MLIDCTQYTFFPYVDDYGIFDEDGCLVGLKEEAPLEARESFEKYQKKCDEFEAKGLM